MDRNINRIKVMLADRGKTNRRLATQLGVGQATISTFGTLDNTKYQRHR